MSASHQQTNLTSRLFVLAIAFLAPVFAPSLFAQTYYPEPRRDLSGFWAFELDRTDSGVEQKWFSRRLRGYIKLPGILQAQNQGDEITIDTPWVASLYDRFWFLRKDYKDYTERNVRVPFLSQPPRHYLGVAWYQKEIEILPTWANRRILLTLERPHWETTVWIDEKKIGSDRSLVAPHIYDLGTVTPGRHRLTIRVDNRMLMPYRPDAHSVSDSLGASWNGIAGRIDLTATNRVWIDDVRAFPNLQKRMMLVRIRVGNQTGLNGSGTITAIWPDIGVVPISWDENGGTAEVEVPLRDDIVPWDEFNPKLYTLRVWLRAPGIDEYKEIQIGLRDFHAVGNEFYLNDRPIYFRGTHHGGDFPLTGYPATDVTYWKKLFETCRKWGLNHMRFHSWCPPEAAFQAADELGFYLQPEPGMWNEINPETAMERMPFSETDRMIKAYGNHPSFMLLSASNEPKGGWKASLTKWVERYRKEDPRRLYVSGTGHTEREVPDITEGTDYLAIQRIGPKLLRRESGWFGGDYRESLTDINIPVIAHEVGQWVAYPDFDVIKKFTGYLKAGNFEIFRDSLKEHNLLEKNKIFAELSSHLQFECYKEEIEANLRTPGLSGFQLLDLHDYLGQGTALVGLLDPFWDAKFANPEDFRDFCNSTVPLARLRQRIFTTANRFDVDVEIAHYGAKPLENMLAVWRINDGGKDLQGEWPVSMIPIGKNTLLGKISLDLWKMKAPREGRLTVTVGPLSFFSPVDRKILSIPEAIRGVTYWQNQWNFWIYPADASLRANPSGSAPAGECEPSRVQDVLITNSWEEAEAKLAAGGKVLLSPRNSDLDWTSPPLDTVPVFWNRQMGPAWARMLGLWIHLPLSELRKHTLDGFPTDSYFDWQWAQLMLGTRAVNLDRLPKEIDPTVWGIDDWNRNYKLGVVFECVVGRGRLLVSAIDVTKKSDSNPVLAQLRAALTTYVRGDCFQPNVAVSPEEFRSLFFDTRIMSKLHATASVGGEPAGQVIDGDPNTYLLVGNQKAPAREQVEVVITFPSPVEMSGLVVMPRQNHREHEGDIKDYTVQVSDDGTLWSDIARGEFPSSYEPHRVEFSRPIRTRYLKLVSLTGFGTDKTTSLSELAVIYAGPKLDDKGQLIEYQRSRTATPEIDEGPDKPKSPAKPKP